MVPCSFEPIWTNSGPKGFKYPLQTSCCLPRHMRLNNHSDLRDSGSKHKDMKTCFIHPGSNVAVVTWFGHNAELGAVSRVVFYSHWPLVLSLNSSEVLSQTVPTLRWRPRNAGAHSHSRTAHLLNSGGMIWFPLLRLLLDLFLVFSNQQLFSSHSNFSALQFPLLI